jgi:hypothetical protein
MENKNNDFVAKKYSTFMNISDINSFWLILENRQNFLLYFDIGANSGVLCRGGG